MRRPGLLIALAACSVAALLPPSSAGAAPAKRDQVAALRVSVDWITEYRPRLWVAIANPGPCVEQRGGTRRCPIAIVIKAWVGGELRAHRCAAEAVLPRRGDDRGPRRTSARCTLGRAPGQSGRSST